LVSVLISFMGGVRSGGVFTIDGGLLIVACE
jgi:hypothetical protein